MWAGPPAAATGRDLDVPAGAASQRQLAGHYLSEEPPTCGGGAESDAISAYVLRAASRRRKVWAMAADDPIEDP